MGLEKRRNASQQPPPSFKPQQLRTLSPFRVHKHSPLGGAHAEEDIASRGESVGGTKEKSREARLGPRRWKEKKWNSTPLSLSLAHSLASLDPDLSSLSSSFLFSFYTNEKSKARLDFSRPPRSLRR